MSIHKKMIEVQSELKAPKNQRNNFGNYNYRSCEDIIEAVKPILAEKELLLTISDELVEVGERNYIKAVVTVSDGDDKITVTGFAREAVNKKGMDEMQLTGATSSYARKYALNGMFAIDDTKDADTDSFQKRKSKNDNQSSSSSKSKTPTKKQLAGLKDWLDDEKGKSVIVEYLKKRKINNLTKLTYKQAENLLKKVSEEVS